MLAYVFWHRPRDGVEPKAYEGAQRAFHRALAIESASFRVAALPFGAGSAGYEDWYLVDGWQALGELNEMAVDELHRPSHDDAAGFAAEGWGGVYAPVRGEPSIPEGAEWLDKPRGKASADFIASRSGATVWRRQLVLGPAAEFCVAAPPTPGREAIWPT